jgi:phage terminase large subunit GpA-like protein
MESWLLEHGEIYGETNEPDVWEALAEFRRRRFEGVPITRCFVDQKYRSQHVFAFCRKNAPWAFPAAGYMPRTSSPETETALRSAQIEVDVDGKLLGKGRGLTRWTANTDYFKRWIYDRIDAGPTGQGVFWIAADASDDYCAQLVAEARTVTPAGRVLWMRLSRENHYLDCEMLGLACAHSLRLQHYAEPIPEGTRETRPKPPPPRGRYPYTPRGGGNWTKGYR